MFGRLEIDWAVEQETTSPYTIQGQCSARRRGHPQGAEGALLSPLGQPPCSGFQMSPDKHWHGSKETPPPPASCETAALVAYSLDSQRIYLREGMGGEKKKRDALANPEKEDRNSKHSSRCKFGAAICQPIC